MECWSECAATSDRVECSLRALDGTEAVPRNLPRTPNLLQHKQLLVRLCARPSRREYSLRPFRGRPGKCILLAHDFDLLDRELDVQCDLGEAPSVPGFDGGVSDLGREALGHGHTIGCVEGHDVSGGRGDEVFEVGCQEGADVLVGGRHFKSCVVSRVAFAWVDCGMADS